MIISAKFASVCPKCNGKIEAGSKVEWSKGKKAICENCHNQELTQSAAEQENKSFRVFDTIQVNDNFIYNGSMGNKEIAISKGIKGTINSDQTRKEFINGQLMEVVAIEEKIRKGQQPKTQTGFFFAPLELITITKKAK